MVPFRQLDRVFAVRKGTSVRLRAVARLGRPERCSKSPAIWGTPVVRSTWSQRPPAIAGQMIMPIRSSEECPLALCTQGYGFGAEAARVPIHVAR